MKANANLQRARFGLARGAKLMHVKALSNPYLIV